jgi:DNA polymerase alpha subunit A
MDVNMMDHVFPEFSQIARQKGIKKHKCKVTKRGYMYHFQDPSIPAESEYLKVVYSAEYPVFPADLAGRSFSRVLGTSQSCMELFLLKRDLMGPCWVNIQGAQAVTSQLSWCKHELRISDPKSLSVVKNGPESPPFCIMSLHMQTIKNEREHSNEIVMLSALIHHSVNVDGPTDKPENQYKGFTAVRKLEGTAWPLDLQGKIDDWNKKRKDTPRAIHANERALLSWFLAKLHAVDPDVIVGHNWLGFDLDVLLHRMQRLKIPAWSKLGRLRRSVMPKLQSNAGGMGTVTWAEKMIMSGRLICDTYLSAKENLRETTYTLTELTKTQLGKERQEIDFQQVGGYFSKSVDLLQLMKHNENDTYLAASLMFKMMVLPLTKQLTNLAGNLWNRSLLSARAERVEYLLLHEFHRLKYVLPEKAVFNNKKGGFAADDGDDEDGDGEEGGGSKKWSKRKKAAYSGGLVLDPKRGLYDKYIMVLDFNSLYPTIIQEFNICFTTVSPPQPQMEDEERPKHAMPDKDGKPGVLPKVIKTLVDRRRQVKELLKKESNEVRKQQLDIRQSALKIMANSMYGCLGFTYSRFYAKPLAEMVTLQGRELLQRTVDVTQNKLQLEVVYGDTDSIFVNSGCDNIQDANKVAREAQKELNRMWRLLELGLDGMYCPLLLLNKKKYAALEVTEHNGVSTKVKVRKGLDIVRRDWCVLAKRVGDKILDFILSGDSVDDVVNNVHSYLREIHDQVENDKLPLTEFVITKGLTKGPEEYSDAKAQPHVQVALRMKAQGKPMRAGDHVPYVICKDDNQPSFAMRAQDPAVVEAMKYSLDKSWYMESQLHPVVSRICAVIQGTDPGQLASCLGLDSAKFHKADTAGDAERKSAFAQQQEASDRFENVEKFSGMCSDGLCRDFMGVYVQDKMGYLRCGFKSTDGGPDVSFNPRAMRLQLQHFFRNCLARYHDGWLVCSDAMCAHRTRNVLCDVYRDGEQVAYGLKCPQPACAGKMRIEYTSEQLYLQILYVKQLFDLQHAERKLAEENAVREQRNLQRLQAPALDDEDKVDCLKGCVCVPYQLAGDVEDALEMWQML